MILLLLKGGFKLKYVMFIEEEIMKMKEYLKKGWILEVDLEYFEELYNDYNSYLFVLGKK